MRYKAFISYSHQDGIKRAAVLHSALHRFTKPWYKLRALHIFRDQVNLSVTPKLWPTIQEALNNSEYFVLLASVQAASSKWVIEEIKHWCANKDPNKILIVLISGHISWGHDDFDWDKTTALPKALSGKFTHEPLWINLSWVESDEQMSLRNLQFRDQVATLAAVLHGRTKEELDSEDVRENRKAKRLAKGAIVALTVLTISALALASLFYHQYTIAEERLRVALSRQLAAQANSYLESQYDLALLLSVSSYKTSPTIEGRGSLLTALRKHKNLAFLLRNPIPLDNHFTQTSLISIPQKIVQLVSAGERTVISAGTDGQIAFWDAGQKKLLHEEVISGPNSHPRLAVTPDGKKLVTVAGGKLTLWDVSSPKTKLDEKKPGPQSTGYLIAAAHPDNITIATNGSSGTLALWRINASSRLEQIQEFSHDDDGIDPKNIRLAFSAEGKMLVMGSKKGDILRWDVTDIKNPRPLKKLPAHDQEVERFRFSPGGRWLASADSAGKLLIWDARNFTFKKTRLKVGSFAFSPDDELLAFRDDNRINTLVVNELWEGGGTINTVGSYPGAALAFNKDSHVVMSGNHDGTMIFWRLDGSSNFLRDTLGGHSAPVVSTAFSPDGVLHASGDDDGSVILTELSNRSQTVLTTLAPDTPARRLAFSPDSRALASSSDDGSVTLWEQHNGWKPVLLRGATQTHIHSDQSLTQAERLSHSLTRAERSSHPVRKGRLSAGTSPISGCSRRSSYRLTT